MKVKYVNIHGETIIKDFELPTPRQLSPAELQKIAQSIREDQRALGAYALNHPETPVH